MAIQDQLGKMVGPLPLGAWIAVVGGALGLAIYSRRSQSDPEPVEDNEGVPGVGLGGSGLYVPLNPQQGQDRETPPADNDEWGRRALNYLIARNMDSARSSDAIYRYLEGTLPATDVMGWALVRMALAGIGSPPVLPPSFGNPAPTPTPGPVRPPGINPPSPPILRRPPVLRRPPRGPLPPVVAPKPKPQPKPKPKPQPKRTYYTVRAGDTLTRIGARFRIPWERIYQANKDKIKNPNQIYPGQRLLIPN